MVRDRNAEHVLAEKGSSSHPKRQPLSSLVEDEAEPVQEAEGGENGEEGTVGVTEVRSRTAFVPFAAKLTNPIFQQMSPVNILRLTRYNFGNDNKSDCVFFFLCHALLAVLN
ncbi:LOW QUALITY PROTEIN: hypothetical protein YC2023_092457 [Brassica napus]